MRNLLLGGAALVSLGACASLGIGEDVQSCIVTNAVALVMDGGFDDLGPQAAADLVATSCGVDVTILVTDAINAALEAANEAK